MKKFKLLLFLVLLALIGYWAIVEFVFHTPFEIGQPIDSLNNVYVYYNGSVKNVTGRNLTKEGYNLGLKFQCVEFVKRYYYEYLNHKMPDSYGHAKDFFNEKLNDGEHNKKRNLYQYSNPSKIKPEVNDLIVFGATLFNKYGHVAIISQVTENKIEIVQQNPGKFKNTRKCLSLKKIKEKWEIVDPDVLGWLRKK